MTKQDFMNDLRARITGVRPEDINRSLDYYSEMIDDRIEEGVPEEEAVAAMGNTQEIAEKIISELSSGSITPRSGKHSRQTGASSRQHTAPPNTSQQYASQAYSQPTYYQSGTSSYSSAASWFQKTFSDPSSRLAFIIILIATAPVWLPALLSVIALFFSIYISVICLAIAGTGGIIQAIIELLTGSHVHGLFALGIGMMLLGAFYPLLRLVGFLEKKLWWGVKELISFIKTIFREWR